MAKQTCYAATARLWLGGRVSYADAERSVQLYEADPPEQRRLGELCLARLDLAVARLGRDDLGGTADQVENVFTVAAGRRTDSVTRRLLHVADALERPRFQTSALALGLRDNIRSFTRTPTAPALPGAAG